MQEITKATVLAALNKLELDGMYNSWPAKGGICRYVQSSLASDRDGNRKVGAILKPIFRTWPKYSGNSWYPVPHPLQPEDADEDDIRYLAEQAFEDEYADDMWTGEYGELRKELLAFCIEQLGKELSE